MSTRSSQRVKSRASQEPETPQPRPSKVARSSSQPLRPVNGTAGPSQGESSRSQTQAGAGKSARGTRLAERAERADTAPAAAPEEKSDYLRVSAKYADAAELLKDNVSLSQEEVDKLVSTVMRHMLFKKTTSGGAPVTRTELSKLISDNHAKGKGNARLGTYILLRAQEKFPLLLGMEMKELDRARSAAAEKKAAANDTSATKCFVLRSLVPTGLRAAFVETREDQLEHAFLMVVLASLHLAGGSVEEEELWEHLEGLAVVKGVEHPLYGKPEDQMNRLVVRRYLQKEKVVEHGVENIMLTYGENALDEVPGESLERFIAEVMVQKAGNGGEEDDVDVEVLDDDDD